MRGSEERKEEFLPRTTLTNTNRKQEEKSHAEALRTQRNKEGFNHGGGLSCGQFGGTRRGIRDFCLLFYRKAHTMPPLIRAVTGIAISVKVKLIFVRDNYIFIL